MYWFCHISTWIHQRYTCVPHPEPSSLFPPGTIPLGHPSAPAPSIQYRALDLDWWLVSYIILYMFQCQSPKSSHPRPLPESTRLFYTSVSLLLQRKQILISGKQVTIMITHPTCGLKKRNEQVCNKCYGCLGRNGPGRWGVWADFSKENLWLGPERA